MLLPAMVLFAVAANYALFLYFRHSLKEGSHPLRMIVTTALTFASMRTCSVALGAYWLGSPGSLQILGYLLVNLGLPEIVLAGREQPGGGSRWLMTAAASVFFGSVLWIAGVGLVALRFQRKTTRP